MEISLILDDSENRVSLNTSTIAERRPEALPKGTFFQVYFYIADLGNSVIRKVDIASGIIITVTGTGGAGYSEDDWVATKADVNGPRFIYVSPNYPYET